MLLKYSPEGGDVRLSVREQEGHATVMISDQGIGMNPQEQAKLFVLFQRAPGHGWSAADLVSGYTSLPRSSNSMAAGWG
jgi:K+-sensing histidine kinase KdpD